MTTQQPLNKKYERKSSAVLDRAQRDILILAVLLACFGVICLAITFPVLYIWNDIAEDEVLGIAPAGHVVNVSLTAGLWTRALVQSDTGFYSLADGASLDKGEALTLETRGNRSRFLCDSRQHCMQLSESLDKPRPKLAAAGKETGSGVVVANPTAPTSDARP